MNVDNNEIEKFSAIASRWWDLSGEFKPLHEINPLRVDFINYHAHGLFDKKILDVGCGGGILSESMAKLKAKVTGIDLAEASLEVARLHALESTIEVDYQCISAEAMAEKNAGKYDVVTCLEMLEHVPNPASIVAACATLVKPGGYVFFSTLNRNIKSYLMAIVAAEKVFKLVPDGTHDHGKFIQPAELAAWARATDLLPLSATGLHMNPLTRQYYLSDNNLDVNYLVCYQRQERA